MKYRDKTISDTLGKLRHYEEITFGIQELYLQIETAIILKILGFVQTIVGTVSSQSEEDVISTQLAFADSMKNNRQKECTVVDASKGVSVDFDLIQVDKVSFGQIHITTIAISISL